MTDDREAFGFTPARNVSDSEAFGYTLALCAVSVLTLDVVFFVFATILRTDKLKDVAGGCGFSLVALLSLCINIQLKVRRFKSTFS